MNGHCLCGAVRFTSPEVKDIGVCHCGICRRWGGGPLLAVLCGAHVAFEGADQITTYASSTWAERAFCKRCGSHLYYKLLATGEYFVPAGVLDSTDLKLVSQIYIDNKPAYYSFSNETQMLTELQFLELYSVQNSDAGSRQDK
jgi:hypothetical protein